MLEQVVGGPSFGPDFTEEDVEPIAREFEISDRARLAEVLTLARDVHRFNEETIDDLPSPAAIRAQTKRILGRLKSLKSAISDADDLTRTRLARLPASAITEQHRMRIPDLTEALEIEWRPDALAESAGRLSELYVDRKRGLYARYIGADVVDVDLDEVYAALEMLVVGAENSLTTLADKRPLETKTKGVEVAVSGLASYYVDELGRSFTQEFDDRGQPKSEAALFVQAVFKLIAPNVPTSTLRTHMRNVVADRLARASRAS